MTSRSLPGFCRYNCWRLSKSFVLQKQAWSFRQATLLWTPIFLASLDVVWRYKLDLGSPWAGPWWSPPLRGQVLWGPWSASAPGQAPSGGRKHFENQIFQLPFKRCWPGWAPARWRWRQRRWRERRSRVLPSSPLDGSQGWWWHKVVYMPIMVSRIVIINLKLRMKRSWRAAEKLAKAA